MNTINRNFLLSMEAQDGSGVIQRVNYWLTVTALDPKLTRTVLQDAIKDWCNQLSAQGVTCDPNKVMITFVLELDE